MPGALSDGSMMGTPPVNASMQLVTHPELDESSAKRPLRMMARPANCRQAHACRVHRLAVHRCQMVAQAAWPMLLLHLALPQRRAIEQGGPPDMPLRNQLCAGRYAADLEEEVGVEGSVQDSIDADQQQLKDARNVERDILARVKQDVTDQMDLSDMENSVRERYLKVRLNHAGPLRVAADAANFQLATITWCLSHSDLAWAPMVSDAAARAQDMADELDMGEVDSRARQQYERGEQHTSAGTLTAVPVVNLIEHLPLCIPG